MSHIFLCKLAYLINTPFQNLKLQLKGVKTKGFVFTGGRIFVDREKNGNLSIGRNCRFMSKSWGNKIGLNHRCMLSVGPNANLSIGDCCSFSGASIWCFKSITLENNVRIGANCLIIDGDAHQDDPRAGENNPVHICKNVWLGANVVVLKGVNIGENSLIGMNSVVTKDIPANVVAAGNPCRVIKQLSEETIQKLPK